MIRDEYSTRRRVMKKIVVTGGNGRLGPWIIRELLDHGYEVLNVDLRQPVDALTKTVVANLENLGEVYHVLLGADAVIHMAAIPVPFKNPNDVVFRNNVMSTFNILEAASNLGIKKAVIGSSEASYGICNAPIEPEYLPLDEDHPQLPWDCYGLSKIVNEETAKTIHRRSGMQIVCMRLGNVISPEMYSNFPGFINNSEKRKHLLWSYIDARDAASACRLAVEKDNLGFLELNIASDETSMNIKTRDLINEQYPEVKNIRENFSGYETLLANKRAKKILGWQPVHSWRNEVQI